MTGLQPKPARRVLVIEDEPAVGRLIVEILEAAGYDAWHAANAEAAVAAARERDYDAAISDLVLGDRDGHDVANALLDIQPRLKVMFMSGYGASRYGPTPNDPILAKPFNASELLARVERLLAG
jgi:DNA-binding response OmpR family regulator